MAAAAYHSSSPGGKGNDDVRAMDELLRSAMDVTVQRRRRHHEEEQQRRVAAVTVHHDSTFTGGAAENDDDDGGGGGGGGDDGESDGMMTTTTTTATPVQQREEQSARFIAAGISGTMTPGASGSLDPGAATTSRRGGGSHPDGGGTSSSLTKRRRTGGSGEASSSSSSSLLSADPTIRRAPPGSGQFYAKISGSGDIKAVLRDLEFLKFCFDVHIVLIFGPDGLLSKGHCPRRTYVFENFLHRSFFAEYEATTTVAIGMSIDELWRTIKDMQKIFNPDFITLERQGSFLLVKDNDRNQALIPARSCDVPVPTEVERRLDGLVYRYHIKLAIDKFVKCIDKTMPPDVRSVEFAYFEGSHVRVRWNQYTTRFPVLSDGNDTTAAAAAHEEDHAVGNGPMNGVTTGHVSGAGGPMEALERRGTAPAFACQYPRIFLTPVCRTAFSDYVTFRFTPDGNLLMADMTMHRHEEDLRNQSYVRLWVRAFN